VVELLAEVALDGTALHLEDVAVYPRGATRLALGAGEVIALARRLGQEARALGFAELRITGVRYSGASPGKEVDIRIDLTRL
jgi:hypothetical protein